MAYSLLALEKRAASLGRQRSRQYTGVLDKAALRMRAG
jgi:hypothetical protein